MEYVEREAQGGCTILRLSRPPVNALWIEILGELAQALASEAAGGAEAIVLTGSGSCFSAGLDTKAVTSASRAERIAGVRAINGTVLELFGSRLPVVAAVNGHALGGGLVLPLACDQIVATRGPCKLGLAEAAAGIPFPAAALAAARARLAPSVLNNLCLTARTFGPSEALALGVADELSEPDAVVARAVELANGLAGLPAFRRVKQQLRADQAAEMEKLARQDPMLDSWIE